MDKRLEGYLKTKIIKLYQIFDKAHQENHIYQVIESSLEISQNYDVRYDMVYTIACYHDIGMQYGRKDHHLTGGLFLYNDKQLRLHFTEENMLLMKEAIEDHRASRQEHPRSIYGKIIAEADRDIDPKRIILRTSQVALSKKPNSDSAQHFAQVYKHLEEKYGITGYLKLWLKTKRNQNGLAEIQKLLSNKQKLKSIVARHYVSIKKGST